MASIKDRITSSTTSVTNGKDLIAKAITSNLGTNASKSETFSSLASKIKTTESSLKVSSVEIINNFNLPEEQNLRYKIINNFVDKTYYYISPLSGGIVRKYSIASSTCSDMSNLGISSSTTIISDNKNGIYVTNKSRYIISLVCTKSSSTVYNYTIYKINQSTGSVTSLLKYTGNNSLGSTRMQFRIDCSSDKVPLHISESLINGVAYSVSDIPLFDIGTSTMSKNNLLTLDNDLSTSSVYYENDNIGILYPKTGKKIAVLMNKSSNTTTNLPLSLGVVYLSYDSYISSINAPYSIVKNNFLNIISLSERRTSYNYTNDTSLEDRNNYDINIISINLSDYSVKTQSVMDIIRNKLSVFEVTSKDGSDGSMGKLYFSYDVSDNSFYIHNNYENMNKLVLSNMTTQNKSLKIKFTID